MGSYLIIKRPIIKKKPIGHIAQYITHSKQKHKLEQSYDYTSRFHVLFESGANKNILYPGLLRVKFTKAIINVLYQCIRDKGLSVVVFQISNQLHSIKICVQHSFSLLNNRILSKGIIANLCLNLTYQMKRYSYASFI